LVRDLFRAHINHPGRNKPLQYINYLCAAATPPSKGGETSSIPTYNKIMRLKLTAMGKGDVKDKRQKATKPENK
jgi:hypothetical protein